ncbi:MAG: TolC family protein [Candidatus Binatia bacterium]
MKRPLVVALALSLGAATNARGAPLDLTACVRLAIAHNPDVQDAADSAVSAVLSRDVPLSEYRFKLVPSVSGGLQGSNNTNQYYDLDVSRKLMATGTQIDLTGGTSVYSAVPQLSVPYLSETRITVTQPLWQGRSRLENSDRLDDAERRVGAAKNALAGAREDLALQVTRGFYDVVRAEALVRIAGTSLDRVSELDQIGRAKLTIGAVSKMDVFRTELHATRLKNALVEQQAKHESALDQLRGLLGLGADVPFEIDARDAGVSPDRPEAKPLEGIGIAPPPGARVEQAVEDALEKRVEVTEAREQVTDAERKAVLARYKIWPAISLLGSYARLGTGDDFEESSHLNRTEWLVGVTSTTPLDRTEERVAAAQAELALRGRERRLRAVRDQTIRQVREAWRQLERARAARTLAGEIVEQAKKQTELARFRYEKGITDNFDLMQAESELAEARGGQVLAAIDEILAAAAVRHATGTLEEAFGVADERLDGEHH